MHLREWKRTGLLYHLAADLRDPDAALKDIASRLDESDQRFFIVQDATLWAKVNDVLCFEIAWEGRDIFQADIVMCGLNDDELSCFYCTPSLDPPRSRKLSPCLAGIRRYSNPLWISTFLTRRNCSKESGHTTIPI
jgi:hypothetical protein